MEMQSLGSSAARCEIEIKTQETAMAATPAATPSTQPLPELFTEKVHKRSVLSIGIRGFNGWVDVQVTQAATV